MISICIPVYNFDISALVRDLKRQADEIEQTVEIIVIDDASGLPFRKSNGSLSAVTRYVQLEQNIGRARIRNLFLQHTSLPWLLFLDCDVSVRSNPGFLRDYLNAASDGADVICGGRIYPEKCPSAEQALSWKYGKTTESRSAARRSLHAAANFMTNNFLIKRELLASIPFEESIQQYGHEDTLFGIRLQKSHAKVLHIENPVLNLHIETNPRFLDKTRQGIDNLVSLVSNGKITAGDQKKIRLLKTYGRLKKYRLDSSWGYLYDRAETRIIQNLKSSAPRLLLFNLYKLGMLHRSFMASGKK